MESASPIDVVKSRSPIDWDGCGGKGEVVESPNVLESQNTSGTESPGKGKLEKKRKQDRIGVVRFAHRNEGNVKNGNRRHITIAYIVRSEVQMQKDEKQQENVKAKFTGDVEYGASIFRLVCPHDKYNRQNHEVTAGIRLENHPIVGTYVWESLHDLENKLRTRMYKDGVRVVSPKDQGSAMSPKIRIAHETLNSCVAAWQ
jgi:hypothetical protein